jgi:hypothetical protein
MDRRSVVSLAAVVASGLSVSACMEPPRNDGRMFQRWAQAVSEIPTTEAQAVARDQERAQQTLAQAPSPGPPTPTVLLSSEASGLRPAMSIAVVDPLELPNARDMGLRAAMTVADAVMSERPARMQPASMTVTRAAARPVEAGTWFAQIAAFRSRADAEATWRDSRPALCRPRPPQPRSAAPPASRTAGAPRAAPRPDGPLQSL